MPTLMFYDGQEHWPQKPQETFLLDATYAAGASIATTTTLTVAASDGGGAITSINSGSTVYLSATVTGTTAGSVIFERLSGSSWVSISTDTANPWKATYAPTSDTSFRARYLGSGNYLASTSGTKAIHAKVLTTYVRTYTCRASATYAENGSKRTDTNYIYQGKISSVWGIQSSVMTFGASTTTIPTDMDDANSIIKVEVYLNALHWGPNDGGTARIHTTENSTIPSTWSGVNGLSGGQDVGWSTKTGAKWCNITSEAGSLAGWKTSGAKRGIALYSNSTSTEYYGYFAGEGQSGEPQLRITYDKWV